MASDSGADDDAALRERVAALEETVAEQQATSESPGQPTASRRGFVKAAAAVAGLGALGIYSSYPASAQAAGQVGTQSEPVDVEAWSLNVQDQLAGDLDGGGNNLNNVGAVEADRTFTNSRSVGVVVWTDGTDYYADGTSGTVDSGADAASVIQSAVNEIAGVYIAKGTYNISSTIDIPTGTSVYSDLAGKGGEGAAELVASASIDNIFSLNDTTQGPGSGDGNIIRGLSFDGDNQANCLFIGAESNNWHITENVFKNTSGDALTVQAGLGRIDNNYIYRCDRALNLGGNNFRSVLVRGNRLSVNNKQIKISNNDIAGRIWIRDNRIGMPNATDVAAGGLLIEAGATRDNEFALDIENNHFYNFAASVDAIHIRGTTERGPIRVKNNTLYGYDRSDGTKTGRKAINLASVDFSRALEIKENYAEGFSQTFPVDLTGLSKSQLSVASNEGQLFVPTVQSGTVSGSTSLTTADSTFAGADNNDISVSFANSYRVAPEVTTDLISAQSGDALRMDTQVQDRSSGSFTFRFLYFGSTGTSSYTATWTAHADAEDQYLA
jgi:hypothetical protein